MLPTQNVLDAPLIRTSTSAAGPAVCIIFLMIQTADSYICDLNQITWCHIPRDHDHDTTRRTLTLRSLFPALFIFQLPSPLLLLLLLLLMFPHFPVWFPIQLFLSFFPFLPICHWYITCPLQAAVNTSVTQITCMSNSFYIPKHQHLHKPLGDMDLVIYDRILTV